MDAALQYMIDKFEHASLVMGEKTSAKSVEAKTQHQKQKGNQSSNAYCSGTHRAVDCSKYKTINAQRDRIIAQHLYFNCLGMGHSSKICRSLVVSVIFTIILPCVINVTSNLAMLVVHHLLHY